MSDRAHADGLYLVTVQDAASLLNASKSFVYGLIKSRRLPAYQLGNGQGAVRIKKDDLIAFIEERRICPAEASKPKPRRTEKLRHIKL